METDDITAEKKARQMDNTQFESILDHLRKMVKSKENIGIALMELVDDVDAIQEIHRQAEIQMKTALNSYTGRMTDQDIVFISLSLIAMLQYDGSYYDKVEEIYSGLSSYSAQKIQGVSRDVLYYYSSPEMKKNSSRKINAALLNAIVPAHYLKPFFDFIYDIYKLNFEYTLSEELDEDFRFVYDSLKDVTNSKKDEIKVGVTKKTYKLIESTKRLITDKDGVLAVIELSKKVVRLIDRRVWNQKIQFENSYLKHGFDAWNASLRNEEENVRKKVRKRKSEGVRSRWKSKYILDGRQVFLVPPLHRIRSTYDYRKIRLIVKNDDKIIYSDDRPDIREIIGGYELRIHEIPVKFPIGHVRYQILAGEEDDIIYDSKEELFRNYLVFDNEQGFEINNHTDYTGTAIFCLKSKCRDCGTVYYYDPKGSYLLAHSKVNADDIFYLGGDVFRFSSSGKPGIYGEKKEHYALKNMDSGEILPLYESVKGLFFTSEDNSSKFELVLDGVHHRLEDYPVQKTPHPGGFKYVVDLPGGKDGIHHIQLNSLRGGKKRQILAQNFALDKNIHTKCERRDGDSYIVSVESYLLPTRLTEEININTFQEEWLTFCAGKTRYSLRIPFDFDFYRLNDGPWRSFSDYLWIDDIQADSTLDVYGSEIKELRVFSNNGILLEEEITLTDKDLFQQVRTGFLQSYSELYDYVSLEFNNGKRKKTLLCYYRCVLNTKKTEINCDPVEKSMMVATEYYGIGKVFFRVMENNKEIFRSIHLKSGEEITVSGLSAFRPYSICFFEREKGLHLQNERKMAEYKRYFYSFDDLPGRAFLIKEIMLYYDVKGHFKNKVCHLYYDTYIYFESKLPNENASSETTPSENAYRGHLYLMQGGARSGYKHLNPVRIDLCGNEKEGMLELAITKDGDGLLYDEKKHRIMPVLEDRNAYDIFTYTIDLSRG